MVDRLDSEHVVVLTTLASVDEARGLVRRLVKDRLVACGTILDGGISIYRWEGDVAEASEAVVLMKTRRDRWAALAATVDELHPYDVPELLALPVEAGLGPYLAWVTAETAGEQGR